MDRLSVLCFAGTYTLALAIDLARVIFRHAARWYLAVGLTALGWAVHTAYLANIAWRTHELPVTGLRDSLLVLAWILVATDLYLVMRTPRPGSVGVFVLPLVLAMLVVAGMRQPDNWAAWGGWLFFWGAVHGLFLVFGAVSTCVAFVAGLMYLAQERRLKHKSTTRPGFALPSLEQSERWNRWAITLAFPLLTAGIVISPVLIVATQRSGGSIVGWTDPKVVSTGVMWICFAGLLHARYRPEWRGKRVMLLTVAAFLFMAFAFVGVGVGGLLPTTHGLPVPAPGSAGRGP